MSLILIFVRTEICQNIQILFIDKCNATERNVINIIESVSASNPFGSTCLYILGVSLPQLSTKDKLIPNLHVTE